MASEDGASDGLRENEAEVETSAAAPRVKKGRFKLPLPSFRNELESSDDSNDSVDNQTKFSLTQRSGVSEDDTDSDESANSSDGEKEIFTPIQERRARNMRRNQERMDRLDEKYRVSVTSKKELFPEDETLGNADLDVQELEGIYPERNGMTLLVDPSQDDPPSALEELQKLYPHRESQILLLFSILSAASQQVEHQDSNQKSYVPAPIFVTGVSGVGKTEVVRDVVQLVKLGAARDQQGECNVASAYIDCVEPTSIESVAQSVYRQLLEDKLKRKSRERKRKRERRYRKKQAKKSKPNPDADTGVNVSHNTTGKNLDGNIDEREVDAAFGVKSFSATAVEIVRLDERKVAAAPARQNMRATTVAARRSAPSEPGNNSEKPDMRSDEAQAVVSSSAHTIIHELGRAIQPVFGNGGTAQKSAVLVLDHAERLMSMAPNSGSDRNSFLAQFLLLPKVFEVNLNVIIITGSCLLENSRIQYLSSEFVGDLAELCHSLRVHFPAYKGIDTYVQILQTPRMLPLIIGDEPLASLDPFHKAVASKFIYTLVESLSSSTTDLREFLRVGRRLWPLYNEPLHPSRIEKTLEQVRKNNHESEQSIPEDDDSQMDKDMLALLDLKIRPHMRNALQHQLWSLSGTSEELNLGSQSSVGKGASKASGPSYECKCLMLAAFICQHNRPDKDKQVFTIQRSGRRRGRGRRDAAEDGIAFGSISADQSHHRTTRLRPFSLERMLSVFVTIMGLNAKDAASRSSEELLGSTLFFENLAHLRESEILYLPGRAALGSERINIVDPKYCCSLARDEAQWIAESVDFDLQKYLV